MKVQPYLLDKLTRWEFFQFMYSVLSITEKLKDEMPPSFTAKLQELRTAFDFFDVELTEERKPPSKKLIQADKDRDYTIRKMHQLIRDYSNYRFDAEKERGAKTLLKLFKRHGTGSKISRSRQDTQSVVMKYLLDELAKEDAKQHLETLDLTSAFEALVVYNKTFYTEQLIFHTLQAKYVNEVVKNARLDVQTRFLEFVDITNALAIVEGDAKYVDLKKTIGVLWREYVATMRQRRKKLVANNSKGAL